MKKTLRIVSWNIAGAHKMRSLERFDYSGEDCKYFADALLSLDPDIICLQETHSNDHRSTASEIASLLDMPYVYEAQASPSHIDNAYTLGNAIISKIELTHTIDITYPDPEFELRFSNGSPATRHGKMAQIYTSGGITIANTQMLPLGIFGASYSEGQGRMLAESIEKTLVKNLMTPLVFCGDFNFDTPSTIYPTLYSALSLREAPPDKLTRPNKNNAKQTPDHILISNNIAIASSDIVEVAADHYLCYIDVELMVH